MALVLMLKANTLYAQCRAILGFLFASILDDEDDSEDDSNEKSEN